MTPPPVSKPATWPTPIGIVCLVFGIGGLIGGILSPLINKASQSMVAMDPNAASSEMDAAMSEAMASTAIIAPIGAVVALILTIGGILLLMRKPACRMLLLGWAVLKMLYAVVASFISYGASKKMTSTLMSGDDMPEGMDGMMSGIAAGGAVVGTLWAWALPIFLIVWFLRKPVVAEIQSWAAGR